MLAVQSIEKRYGDVVAVSGVSFTLAKGETLGLLGPNGAGKTTTVSIIAGLLAADAGTVLVDGERLRGDADPAKHKLGLVPQDLALYDELTGRDNLALFGALYGLDGAALAKAIAGALDVVSLADRAGDRVKDYSGGMKRRLNLAAALLHDPGLIILDEPTVGVDPQSRNAIFDNLEQLKARGKSILYTTHYMEEAERLCDRIVIMDRGKVVADDTLRGLYRQAPASNQLRVDLDDGADGWLADLKAVPGVSDATITANQLRVGLTDLAAGAPVVLRWLNERKVTYSHFASDRPDLEGIFLTLTGRRLRD